VFHWLPSVPASFEARSRELAPHAWATGAIIVVNLIVFGLTDGGADAIGRWDISMWSLGAGEWWRLVTSSFVNFGLLFLLANLTVLSIIGPFVERLYGSVGFLALYLVSAMAGTFAAAALGSSLPWGASIGNFACLGLLGGFVLRRRHAVPIRAFLPYLGFANVLIFWAVLGGLAPGASPIGFAGGLTAGVALGLVTAGPLTPASLPRRAARALIAAAVSIALLGVSLLSFRGS
jgi:membrane associated rhomboid family serine protease